MAELIPQLPSQPPPEPVPERPKYNSTSSIFIDSTISRPCIDEIIFCVSIVIHDRIEEGEREVRRARARSGPGGGCLLLPLCEARRDG
jgi:hypothetical protein